MNGGVGLAEKAIHFELDFSTGVMGSFSIGVDTRIGTGKHEIRGSIRLGVLLAPPVSAENPSVTGSSN
jgi:hypothetical protein